LANPASILRFDAWYAMKIVRMMKRATTMRRLLKIRDSI